MKKESASLKKIGTRIPVELWQQFSAAAGARGLKKEVALVEAIRGWLERPSGVPPKRTHAALQSDAKRWAELARRALVVTDSHWKALLNSIEHQLGIIADHADEEAKAKERVSETQADRKNNQT